MKKDELLRIASFDELVKYEPEILARITRLPNGGLLFLAHPFRLLADVGVQLSDAARKEVLAREPELGALSDIPYNAIKASKEEQRVRVQLRGLFQRAMP